MAWIVGKSDCCGEAERRELLQKWGPDDEINRKIGAQHFDVPRPERQLYLCFSDLYYHTKSSRGFTFNKRQARDLANGIAYGCVAPTTTLSVEWWSKGPSEVETKQDALRARAPTGPHLADLTRLRPALTGKKTLCHGSRRHPTPPLFLASPSVFSLSLQSSRSIAACSTASRRNRRMEHSKATWLELGIGHSIQGKRRKKAGRNSD